LTKKGRHKSTSTYHFNALCPAFLHVERKRGREATRAYFLMADYYFITRCRVTILQQNDFNAFPDSPLVEGPAYIFYGQICAQVSSKDHSTGSVERKLCIRILCVCHYICEKKSSKVDVNAPLQPTLSRRKK